MKVTKRFLKRHYACIEAVEWFENQKITDSNKLIKFAVKSKDQELLEWANWLIVRMLTRMGKIKYAIFAAEMVLDIYEKKYPDDDKPRLAIEAAKSYESNPSKKTRTDAAKAAAKAAGYATAAAGYAAAAAGYAAKAAGYAAAANAYSSAYATNASAYAAAAHGQATGKMKTKILKYGLTLIKFEKEK